MHAPSGQHATFHLVIHSGYLNVTIGLYRDTHNIALQTLDKKTVSAFLMQSILELLREQRLTFNDLSCITAHCGPAPFTTLRVGIATANGIGFATRLPLIGINGLEVLSRSYPEYTVILNAFCDDIYVGKNGQTSCENIDRFLHQQAALSDTQLTYIGNGVTLHREKIADILGNKVHFLTDYPYEADTELIAQTGYARWLKKEGLVDQILPTYLKQYSAWVRQAHHE